jgi:serine/threonine-protein kinase
MHDSKDPLVERARERVGLTLKDKWKLDTLLGVGGMAAVYSATHRNGMRVAIKMLHPELSLNNEVRTRFLREGYVANRVEHPGAVTVLDDETADDGSVFLVMELFDGETLATRFENKSRVLGGPQILLIADQVLDVLAAAHEKQIVHRDIKPDNIFLTRTGAVKLLDFGIARLRELSTQTSATRSGSTMGTPAYMAPEQARARWDDVDARTDLWAVGATIFKLLTGRVVHVAETLNEQLLAAMTLPAPPIATLVPTVPIPLVEIVDKALAYDKEDRWPDARAMQTAVRNAYRAITGNSPSAARLSLADSDSRVSQEDTVAAASKVPTSLTVARDSAANRTKRPRRRSFFGRVVAAGFLVVLGYLVFGRPTRVMLQAIVSGPPTLAKPNPTGAQDPNAVGSIEPPATELAPTAAPETSNAVAAPVPANSEMMAVAPANGAVAERVEGPTEPAAAPAVPADSTAAATGAAGPAWLAAPAISAAPIVSALNPAAPGTTVNAARVSAPAPAQHTATTQPKSTPLRKSPPPAKKHVTRHHR